MFRFIMQWFIDYINFLRVFRDFQCVVVTILSWQLLKALFFNDSTLIGHSTLIGNSTPNGHNALSWSVCNPIGNLVDTIVLRNACIPFHNWIKILTFVVCWRRWDMMRIERNLRRILLFLSISWLFNHLYLTLLQLCLLLL